MVQLIRMAQSRETPQSLESQSSELAHLLSRLQQSTIHPTPDHERRLRTSEYERTKLESNLEYARAYLTRLELEALAMKAPGRRVEMQRNLHMKKEQLELLFDRLDDLRKLAAEEEKERDDDDESSEGEDLFGDNVPTPSDSVLSTSEIIHDHNPEDSLPPENDPLASSEQTHSLALPSASRTAHPDPEQSQRQRQSQTSNYQQPTQTSATLRPRNTARLSNDQSSEPAPSSVATSTATPAAGTQSPAHLSARAALFANRRQPSTPETSSATAEAILDSQRHEQDALSDSILKMAGALKASSQKFSTTLEADKDVVGKASQGMEKTERGMEAARGRMGMLRRMTEGKGWWGRIILYAWVYGLMLVLVLLVFVMPKLRF